MGSFRHWRRRWQTFLRASRCATDALITPVTSPITTDLARLARTLPADVSPRDLIAHALRELAEHRKTLARVQRCESLLATTDAVFEFAPTGVNSSRLRLPS